MALYLILAALSAVLRILMPPTVVVKPKLLGCRVKANVDCDWGLLKQHYYSISAKV